MMPMAKSVFSTNGGAASRVDADNSPALSRFPRVSLPAPRSAPVFGEHNAEVLQQWLNLSDEQFDEIEKPEGFHMTIP